MEKGCQNCVTCQNCFSCQSSCYSCQSGYGGDNETWNANVETKEEVVEFPDIWHAIYDALDRIAYQLEIANKLNEESLKLMVGNRKPTQRNNSNAVKTKRRKVLDDVDKELRFVPDTIGNKKIVKELKLE